MKLLRMLFETKINIVAKKVFKRMKKKNVRDMIWINLCINLFKNLFVLGHTVIILNIFLLT